MNLGEFIKSWRKTNKVTQEELAKRAGVTKGYISQLENGYMPTGKPITPTYTVLKGLANAMGMDINDFLAAVDTDVSWNDNYVHVKLPSPESVRTIPVYGDLSCGTGLFVEDNVIDFVTVPTSMLPNKSAEYFAQFADGDSMIGAGINPGDLIIFKKTSQVDNGQIGCFCIDDNIATCKKFSQIGGRVYLMPANDAYSPIPIEPENECFRIIGLKVLQIIK